MSAELNLERSKAPDTVRVERTFPRFTIGQRWEHWLLFLSVSALLLTGLPQKYRAAAWSLQILSTPDRVNLIRQIHHISAVVLLLVVLYHLVRNLYLLLRKQLPASIFPNMQDFRNFWQMIKYLLFLSKIKPLYEKYNFEQKFTYWFLFLTIGVMGITGLITWFPVQATRILPGAVIPASRLAHSTEAIVIAIFVLIWHLYHVLIERLNLSMFTGRLSEDDMRNHHTLEYERLLEENNLSPQEEEAELDAQGPE
jgi:formate dehydrogenase gamma subunit